MLVALDSNIFDHLSGSSRCVRPALEDDGSGACFHDHLTD